MFSLWWLEAFSSYFPVVMTLLSVYFFVLLVASVRSPKLLSCL